LNGSLILPNGFFALHLFPFHHCSRPYVSAPSFPAVHNLSSYKSYARRRFPRTKAIHLTTSARRFPRTKGCLA
jgi:hypothetical protein